MADSLSRRLPTLPLWAALQVLGREGIQDRFKRCFVVVEQFYHKIKKLPCISVLVSERNISFVTVVEFFWTEDVENYIYFCHKKPFFVLNNFQVNIVRIQRNSVFFSH